MSKLTAIAQELREATQELETINVNLMAVQDERDRLRVDYERVEKRIKALKELLVGAAIQGEKA
ncbi:hypothetical protein KMC56_gp42 [Achromobacter phage vB_AxyP_19-32_Axy12]|uniref:Uncharacterized protein n=1 Tax=Achromobacter phage vB_AxyP_19-32_Axy12 TaxID=2591043 RepID=A0A514CUK7_9CAUD|nr:hypothetical protein KMC56_gp42 [Achromobacter phage vB_AxyP_19-32_Axy12]QDH84147.1 hypothetical protein Axy12_077 [Achromobacter phage vB_AxyP_19-32_Axy12]